MSQGELVYEQGVEVIMVGIGIEPVKLVFGVKEYLS